MTTKTCPVCGAAASLDAGKYRVTYLCGRTDLYAGQILGEDKYQTTVECRRGKPGLSPLAGKIARLNSLISEAEGLAREIVDDMTDDEGQSRVSGILQYRMSVVLERVEAANHSTPEPEEYENL